MNLRKLLPRGKISQEIFQSLNPVFEGEILYKQERYAEAEARYLEALKDFPAGSGGRFLVYNKLGILYEKLDDPRRAIEIYEKGAKEGTITPFTYQRLALLQLNSGNLREAIDYCQKGLRSLKLAKTDLLQEVYFWFIFQKLKRKIKRSLPSSGKV
jgi:tetratricopeptide (TPR) repeat protein